MSNIYKILGCIFILRISEFSDVVNCQSIFFKDFPKINGLGHLFPQFEFLFGNLGVYLSGSPYVFPLRGLRSFSMSPFLWASPLPVYPTLGFHEAFSSNEWDALFWGSPLRGYPSFGLLTLSNGVLFFWGLPAPGYSWDPPFWTTRHLVPTEYWVPTEFSTLSNGDLGILSFWGGRTCLSAPGYFLIPLLGIGDSWGPPFWTTRQRQVIGTMEPSRENVYTEGAESVLAFGCLDSVVLKPLELP